MYVVVLCACGDSMWCVNAWACVCVYVCFTKVYQLENSSDVKTLNTLSSILQETAIGNGLLIEDDGVFTHYVVHTVAAYYDVDSRNRTLLYESFCVVEYLMLLRYYEVIE